MTILHLGPRGTFTEMAALQVGPDTEPVVSLEVVAQGVKNKHEIWK